MRAWRYDHRSKRVFDLDGLHSDGQSFGVETLREVFGAATNDVVRFLQCPDDIKFVAAPELPAHLEYTGKSVYMRLLSYNHMGSSHWDGRMPPCKTPDQIDG